MKIYDITLPNPPAGDTTLVYTVKASNFVSWVTLFTGKVFVQAGQSHVRIDIGDILWNHKFDAEGMMSPVLNYSGNDFEMCPYQPDLTNYWYNSVQVQIQGGGSLSTNCRFFCYNMFGNPEIMPYPNTVVWNMDHQPTAHLPLNPPAGFKFRQLVYNGSFNKGIDGTTTTEQRQHLGVIEYTGGQSEYTLNGFKVAQIDRCAAPYYLAWMTNSGTMQCQAFLKGTEESIEYKNNNRIDMSNYEWAFNKTVKGKWKLKSKLLSDDDYSSYGQLFNSPYLILLDMKNNRMHYVNVTDTTLNIKKNGSGQKNGKIFFEVGVQAAEVKMV